MPDYLVDEYDWKRYPELTDVQLETLELMSPHPQIKGDFTATVVKVHDGDTVRVRVDWRDFDFPVRLANIDAPELSTGDRGMEARDFLQELVLGEEVEVKVNRLNRVEKWGRLLGDLWVNGISVMDALIHAGHAQPFEFRREGELESFNEMMRKNGWF